MKAAVLMILVLCLMLSGCGSFMSGSYEWEVSHPLDTAPVSDREISARNYGELYEALAQMAHNGIQQGTVFVNEYPQDTLEADARRAARELQQKDPVAAYAVLEIRCDVGISGSKAALAVQIDYLHDRAQIRKIRKVQDHQAVQKALQEALDTCEASIVLLVADFQEADYVQMTEDYALQMPQLVMETPQVSVNVYPESGKARVLELRFSYQTSRDALKDMQKQVLRVFSSADLYITGDDTDGEKLSQLYSFLMNRFEHYRKETSITPSYHLLQHGLGDSKAFASVYAAMCRQAGLEAMVVSGTRAGESWYWNIVESNGAYYHVDLMQSKKMEEFSLRTDEEMEGYVWDYSAYPACTGQAQEEKQEILEKGY